MFPVSIGKDRAGPWDRMEEEKNDSLRVSLYTPGCRWVIAPPPGSSNDLKKPSLCSLQTPLLM